MNEQNEFWAGEFGVQYTDRNQVPPDQRKSFFARVLAQTYGVRSICELGANRGHNLAAVQKLSSNYELTGVEINETAFLELKALPGVTAIHTAIQDFEPPRSYDLVFTSTVLIHINPADLPLVYQKMVHHSNRYILINEYFNPYPVEVTYRGHNNKLFKRDFAGELLDLYPNQLSIVDYGFLWLRVEPTWDNATWVLLEKRSAV